MKKWIIAIMVFFAGSVLFACSRQDNIGKKALLVVSFGTSFPETRARTIEAIEKDLGASFEGWTIKRAFTSSIIRGIIKEREGTEIPGPGEMLDRLAKEGYTTVLVQPTHIIQGEEYNELLEEVERRHSLFSKLNIGKPLLFDEGDFIKAADAIGGQFAEGEAIVLMGHGNEHHPEYNSAYIKLQEVFNGKKLPVYIGIVEGNPGIDSVIERLKTSGIKKVTLMPFMIVAGDHANNDMASDEAGSWKTLLTKAGVHPRIHLHGIGENEQIRKIYVEHAKNAIEM